MSEYAWFDNGRGRQVYRRVRAAGPDNRSGLACPVVIGDCIELKSMVDGKMYDSKSALRRSYRERGYVEVGNEEQRAPPKPKPDRKAIRESAAKALNRVGFSVS